MVKARKFILANYFDGFPKPEDLKLVEENLPSLNDGEFLAEAIYLSVDPYMRAYAERLPLGSTFIGGQIAKIVESKNKSYPIGKYILAFFGWRNYTISDGKPTPHVNFPPPQILPDFEGLPVSLGLGVLGRPGNSAYFGFLDLCKPKPGETVVVSGAAGAVGSHVGQIAKIIGCKVIGIAGSDSKGRKLVEEYSFDHFINYKTENVAQKLKEYAVEGVDCYFDNVGGEISSTVINQMRPFGRISVCGSISAYNAKATEYPSAPIVQPSIVRNQLKIEGFIVSRWLDRWLEGVEQNIKWIKEGKLKYNETVTEGFENMFQAFDDMLQGKNFGKAIVKV